MLVEIPKNSTNPGSKGHGIGYTLWASGAAVAQHLYTVTVVGSIPTSPTKRIKTLYQLIIIFVFFSAETGAPVNDLVAEYNYEFRTETGCYLAGNYKLSQMRNDGLFEYLEAGTQIYIRCDNITD